MQHKLTDEERFCLEGCRSYQQYHHMRSGFEGSRCQFCTIDRSLNNILWEDQHVLAWHVPRQFMRDTLALHWLVVPRRHVRFEVDLTPIEWLSILTAKQYMHERFEYLGGLTHVREGDMRLNSGTVPHLHYNTFVPKGSSEVHIPVMKNPKDREVDQARSARFATRYEAGEVP